MLSLFPRSASANNKNPNLVPLGENESFLGNAGVGRANDSGAVYYNPSGLAELPTGRVSVSGAVYTSVSEHYDAFLTLDNTQIPLDASAFVTIPSAYAATRRFGDWVGAFSVLVPDSIEFDDHVVIATPAHQGNITYFARESELWLGLSLARKLGERWSVGATVFGINHSAKTILGLDFQSVAMPMQVTTSVARESLSTWALSATLGVTYLAADWIRFGLRAQTASIQFAGSVDSFRGS
ncbi:MAG TPA: hypothetical protein VGY54_09055, partial [Polyangiaceae bacterium]|nr:hypothetical protein [Polyangiaceae bacterium]